MAAWQASRPGDRIVEVDIPLSYGIYDVVQDQYLLNTVEFLWDPTKEVGVYIKVCSFLFVSISECFRFVQRMISWRVKGVRVQSHTHLSSACCAP